MDDKVWMSCYSWFSFSNHSRRLFSLRFLQCNHFQHLNHLHNNNYQSNSVSFFFYSACSFYYPAHSVLVFLFISFLWLAEVYPLVFFFLIGIALGNHFPICFYMFRIFKLCPFFKNSLLALEASSHFFPFRAPLHCLLALTFSVKVTEAKLIFSL